jgi:hypothetical protein
MTEIAKPRRCAAPRATVRVLNPGTGPLAWCPGCKCWKPASQVPTGQELRRKDRILATYAPTAH